MSILNIFSPASIRNGLNKTSAKFSNSITQIFSHKKLSDEILEELEDLMISSDMGAEFARKIVKNIKSAKFNKDIDDQEIKKFLSEQIAQILLPFQKELTIDELLKPQVIVLNGVNGSGKTTSIGKIAKLLAGKNKKVMIAACDTFRAAASDQLKIWANLANADIISCLKEGEDPASVAYRALSEAKKQQVDILLIDTAGRLQNKQNLMDELKKINNVIKKIDISAPHQNILVLDATTGQNAKNQLEVFDKIIGIDGLIVTKLDGTAKGGILISLCDQFKKPIYAIGIGEKIEDLQNFSAQEFANKIVGI